jgi:hypothetical protein
MMHFSFYLSAALTVPFVATVVHPVFLVLYCVYVFWNIPKYVHSAHVVVLVLILGGILQSAAWAKPEALSVNVLFFGVVSFFCTMVYSTPTAASVFGGA